MAEVATIQAQTALQPVVSTPMDMLANALASGASVEMMERLLAMQERWESTAARKAFNVAIAAARSRIGPIFKRQTATGGAKFQYESIDDIERQIMPVLAEHGLSYRFRTEGTEAGLTVFCILSHVDGHSEENSMYSAPDQGPGRNAIQSIGSAQTYLQRYTLKAALGLSASKDDDGAKAGMAGEDQADAEQWVDCLRDCKSLAEMEAYFRSIWPDVKNKPAAIRLQVLAAKDAAKKALAGAA